MDTNAPNFHATRPRFPAAYALRGVNNARTRRPCEPTDEVRTLSEEHSVVYVHVTVRAWELCEDPDRFVVRLRRQHSGFRAAVTGHLPVVRLALEQRYAHKDIHESGNVVISITLHNRISAIETAAKSTLCNHVFNY